MSDNKWKINLSMADGTYPVWIRREDEEIVRKAAKQVDDKLKEFKVKWANAEKDQLLTMVAYVFSLESLRQQDRNDTSPYTSKIEELTELLEEYFRKE